MHDARVVHRLHDRAVTSMARPPMLDGIEDDFVVAALAAGRETELHERVPEHVAPGDEVVREEDPEAELHQLLERAGDVGAVHGDPEAGKDDLDRGEPVEHAVPGAVHGPLPVVDRVDEGRQRGGQDVDIHRGPLAYGNRFRSARERRGSCSSGAAGWRARAPSSVRPLRRRSIP